MTENHSPPRLYLITPSMVDATAFAPTLKSVVEAVDAACVLLDHRGADAVQLKKAARELGPIVQSRGGALLIGDSRLAARVDADGAHIDGGGDDGAARLEEAASSLKPSRILGAGGLVMRHDAMSAAELEVDYVMFGEPIDNTAPVSIDELVDRIAWWASIFTVPCVAYARRLQDVGPLAAAGADFVALGECLWTDPRGPTKAACEAWATMNASEASAP